jgi:hypothetical protein
VVSCNVRPYPLSKVKDGTCFSLSKKSKSLFGSSELLKTRGPPNDLIFILVSGI